MARLRKKVLEDNNDDAKIFTLTDFEFGYVRDLNQALMLHTLRSQLISAFLTYVATTRLGYTSIREGYALQYEVDPTTEDHTLKIREVAKADIKQ